MTSTDYVLGTHDAEIARLGLQHRVWRPRMLDVWRRAGIRSGQTVIDVGAGPGYAARDLAEIVGPTGCVAAVERAPNFIKYMQDQAKHHGLANIDILPADLDILDALPRDADATWCRWVLSFVHHPAEIVKKIAQSLRPGGVAVFHEYLDYGTWRLAPRAAAVERFCVEVMASWRAAGGEPDIALELPSFLHANSLQILSTQPLIDMVSPQNFVWAWPQSFVDINLDRLRDLGRMTQAEVDATRTAWRAAEANPATLMVTPCVLEVIAYKP